MSKHAHAREVAAGHRHHSGYFSDSLAAAVWGELDGWAPQTYPAAVELIQQAAPVRELFFIVSGLVKLIYVGEDGKELILDLRPPGWLLGAASFIARRPFPAAVTTVTRCSLLRIPVSDFDSLLKTSPDLSRRLHEMHSHEICIQLDRTTQLVAMSARQRLEGLLRKLISAHVPNAPAGEIKLDLPLKHLEVAQLIAVTPQYLSHLFNELEAEGIIQRSKGWLIILDPLKLRPCGDAHSQPFGSLVI